MTSGARRADWQRWMRGWDEQQESFNPEREHRFSAMFDALEARVGRRFTALDLGSGPGSLSVRLLRRFPAARVVAVDYDPVVRRLGEGAYGTVGGRLTWVDAKLGTHGWTDALPRRRFDAALSTTALHWLTAPALSNLYRDLARLIRRGGVFLNGDYIPWGRSSSELARLGREVMEVRYPGRARSVEWRGWKRWWSAARKFPPLREAFREHDRRQAAHPHHEDVPLEFHLRRLRSAGFRTVAVVWEDFQNRILYAAR